MSSETASAYLHGFSLNYVNAPPPYNDVVKLNVLPSAPLLETPQRAVRSEPSFSSIFGVANAVQFEWNSSYSGLSFLIRDDGGSLQAKGDATSHNTIVQNVNGMEMLKIIERDVDEMNGSTVRTFSVIHKHQMLGTVKVAERAAPRTSLQILGRNGSPVVVKSLKIGDYAIFRDNVSSAPLCNIRMPDVETYCDREFNVKIIFHPQTGITHDEQLLCTAAAIAFKTTMKQTMKIKENEGRCAGCFCGFVCIAIFILALVVFIMFLENYSCEYKKSRGFSSPQC